MTSRGSTIRIFLVDGTPQGIRVVERPGWTGCLLAFARSDYAAARARLECAATGVYVLVGPDPEGSRQFRAYVGEADEVRSRIDAHQRDKDFWTHAFVATTKDGSLNKAHVRYLEARLITLARQAALAGLENGTAPDVPRLSEPEVADMEAYLDRLLPLLTLSGTAIFDVVEPERHSVTAPVATPGPADDDVTYLLQTPLTAARGRDEARGFTVFEGALGRLHGAKMIPSYEALRDRLVIAGILVPHGAEQLRLTRTYVFESPSAAASVLACGSKNGRTEWKDERGRTLKQNQEASAA